MLETLKVESALGSENLKLEYKKANKPKEISILDYTIIAALDKQMPKKPKEHYNWGDFSEDEKLENSRWVCENCQHPLDESWAFCAGCGQKLDWN